MPIMVWKSKSPKEGSNNEMAKGVMSDMSDNNGPSTSYNPVNNNIKKSFN